MRILLSNRMVLHLINYRQSVTPDDLREIHAAAAKIALQGARLPQASLELTRREAPLPKEPR